MYLAFPVRLGTAVINADIGAAIMQHNHSGYNVLWSSRIGAVGGSILAIPLMLVSILMERIFPKDSTTPSLKPGSTRSQAGQRALRLSLERSNKASKRAPLREGVGIAICMAAMLAINSVFWIFSYGIVTAMGMMWMSAKRGRVEPDVTIAKRTTVTQVPMQSVWEPDLKWSMAEDECRR
ncbi:hypothetical protein NCC49_005621 [Naganishia albida]|nr:hypothetical protein NCC49_005621 [Naganishia albida]